MNKDGDFDFVDYGYIGILVIAGIMIISIVIYSSLTVKCMWAIWLFGLIGPYSIGYISVKLFRLLTNKNKPTGKETRP